MGNNTAASHMWNWRLYDVPDNRAFILALEYLFPEDSILVLEFAAIPDSLIRGSKALGLGLPKNRTLVSEFTKTGASHASNTWVTIRLTGAGLRRVFRSEDRWQGDIESWLEHVHVVRDKTYLMTGYDMAADGFVVARAVPEETIKQFCSRVSCKYEKVWEPM